jgi:oligopeptide transport system permease protein
VTAAWRRFRLNRAAVFAAVGLAALVLSCVLFPLVSPYDGYEVEFGQKLELPSPAHPLGTDFFGRDLLTRMALGGRATMFIALVATAIILLIGLVYGAVSGLAGHRIDDVMMRVLDALFAIPRLPWVLIILVLIGAGGNIFTVILALSLFSWMTTARLVRSQIVSLKQNDYIRAARALGARPHQVVVRHLMPNTLGILVVAVLLELPGIIIGEAFVSVLGLGINPPAATWGNIAQDGLNLSNPYFVVLPSAAIALFAVAVNFVADGLQDALDPRREGVARSAAWSPLSGFVRGPAPTPTSVEPAQ